MSDSSHRGSRRVGGGSGAREADRIHRTSPLPLHHQLERILRADIASGRYRPGDSLPSEHELCQRYHISRSVVRQTLASLAHANIVHSERGKGTFVAEPKLQERFVQRAIGFAQDLTRMGFAVSTTVVRQELVELPLHVRDFLQVSQGLRLDRVRAVDGRIVVFVTTYLPIDRFPGLEHEDLNDRSLYAFLDERYRLRVCAGKRTVEAVAASKEVAMRLGVEPGGPLLLLRSASRDAEGHPLEWFEAWHRADRTAFELEIVPGELDAPVRRVVRSPHARAQSLALSGPPPPISGPHHPARLSESSFPLVEALRQHRVMAVLTAPRIGNPVALTAAIDQAGLRVVAVDVRASNGFDALEQASAADSVLVGAWGVRDDRDVGRALEAGARFVVLLPHAVVPEPNGYAVPVLRSALTPTEVGAAWQETQAPVVIYPAGGQGPSYVASLHGSVPEALLVPAGDIPHEEVGDFLRAGACAVALSGELVPPETVAAGDADAVVDRIRVLGETIAESAK
jgi:GntR family transcriptional regulator